MNYTTYTDESYITGERFRSIAAFSFATEKKQEVDSKLKQILQESSVSEFKWQKVKDAKYKFCAIKLIDFIINNIDKCNIRIDVIIWDTYDSRHQVQGRDDNANFERLFFHLLKTSMKRRPKNSHWDIFPDQKHGVDWETVHDCLDAIGKHVEYHKTLFGDFISDPYYHIDNFKEIDSKETTCCQIADLFAGISVFSINVFSKYILWQESQQRSLFKRETPSFSNREKARFEVIRHLDILSKRKKLGVSLRTNQGFFTFNPKNQINFWRYTPQHENDKAPTKIG
ncbi:MAG: DUF3800 domain-containing protein [Promethearchaeota archaeon]